MKKSIKEPHALVNRSTHLLWGAVTGCLLATLWGQSPAQWKAHDMNRPRPPVVEPGQIALPVPPPDDARVLLAGGDLSAWHDGRGGPAPWSSREGYIEVVPGTSSIVSREVFGDVQLHVEWASPVPVAGDGQDRGNSGVYLMGLYEVQVLDSYQNPTYADGQAAAVYGQYPPLFNASRPPGSWQAYDIFFRRPRFDSNGQLLAPARITVVHNGILVQDAVLLRGPTGWLQPHPYRPHPDRLPLALQEHDSPVRYRNIWVRDLPESLDSGPVESADPVLALPDPVLEKYTGEYRFDETGSVLNLLLEEGVLKANLYGARKFELIPRSLTRFDFRWTAAELVFQLDAQGAPQAVVFHIGRQQRHAVRIR